MAHPNPRQTQYQQVHYFRKQVLFSIGTPAVYMGTLPAGAVIVGTDCMVDTAFNAMTTNSLTVGGNSANYNDIATAAQTLAGSTGLTQNIVPTGSSLGSLTADRDIYVMYQQTGTAATAGQAEIIVKYIPNNDQ